MAARWARGSRFLDPYGMLVAVPGLSQRRPARDLRGSGAEGVTGRAGAERGRARAEQRQKLSQKQGAVEE